MKSDPILSTSYQWNGPGRLKSTGSDTCVYDAGARYYNPQLGRFISEDPERGKANLFDYASDNAITGSDLSGMDDCPGGDCGGGPSGGGYSDNSGLSYDLGSILQFIFNYLFPQPTSAAPVSQANYAQHVQLAHQMGNTSHTIGSQDDVNMLAQGGSVAGYHCAQGVDCNITPQMQAAVNCLGNCVGLDLTITSARRSVPAGHPSSSHSRGEAVDIGRNSNPDLARQSLEACFPGCSPNGYSQEEENPPGVPGTHFHIQLNRRPPLQGPYFAPGVQRNQP